MARDIILPIGTKLKFIIECDATYKPGDIAIIESYSELQDNDLVDKSPMSIHLMNPKTNKSRSHGNILIEYNYAIIEELALMPIISYNRLTYLNNE